MKSPTSLRFWQAFAQGAADVFNAFAMMGIGRHCFRAGHWQQAHDLRSHRCYPSPSLRSGPSQAGPSLVWMQGLADCAGWMRNCLEIRVVAIESGAITTNQRGSSPCASRLSCSLFFPRRWPVVCRTLHRAAWPVRSPVRPSLTRWTKTSSLVPLWAALPEPQPAASSLACRPATRATERLTELAACGRAEPIKRTIRADRPGGPLLFV
jgi:hypothetical protein